MKSIWKILVATGVFILIYALTMDISTNEGTINIHLLSRQQNAIILGCGALVAGVILFASIKVRQPAGTDATLTECINSYKPILFRFIRECNRGEKIVMLSTICLLISIATPWFELGSYSTSEGYYIDMPDLAVLLISWSYPIYCFIYRKHAHHLPLIGLSISALWWMLYRYDTITSNNNYFNHSTSVPYTFDIGNGVYIAIFSAAIYIAGSITTSFIMIRRKSLQDL